jgi:ubiquinone/menaquinone biosynthesis C-methylase UbiE
MNSKAKLPPGFSTPTSLPDDKTGPSWQTHNRDWWENNPMRYDWRSPVKAEQFSREFYQEIDRRLFGEAERYMPARKRPFDQIIPFHILPNLDVLEIGVGNGSHAQLLAPHCGTYTGIDLTQYAVTSTSRRFEIFGLKGAIRRMDAEAMLFDDCSFDFIWTWGVIHHSANTAQVLSEMNRVLRPGGQAIVMVYHRSFFYFYIFTALFRGLLVGGFLKTHSLHKLVQWHTDGALARYYRPNEWIPLIKSHGFALESSCIKGQKSELFPLPPSRFKDTLMKATPNAISRFVLNVCRQGSFLISSLRKV